jgi:peptide/nickel transport system permease protein
MTSQSAAQPSSSSAGAMLPSTDEGQASMLRITWRHLRRHPAAIIAIVVLIGITIACVFAFLSPYDPNQIDLANRFAPPSLAHPFGTDKQGRDMLTRLLYGGRVSLAVGFIAMAASVSIGTIVGAIAGYRGGVLDALLMRFTDFMLTFPQIFVLLFLAFLLKESHVELLGGSLANIILVIALTSWMAIARLVRSSFIIIRDTEFVQAARSYGAGPMSLIFAQIMPNAIGPIIVAGTRGVADAILTESGLSFLGYGIQPPSASWGNILQDAFITIGVHPGLTIYPGMMIIVTVLSLNFLGDALRDALDPFKVTGIGR